MSTLAEVDKPHPLVGKSRDDRMYKDMEKLHLA